MSPIKVVFIAVIAFLVCGAFERVHGVWPRQKAPQPLPGLDIRRNSDTNNDYVDVPARGQLPYAAGGSPVRTPPRSPGPGHSPRRSPSPVRTSSRSPVSRPGPHRRTNDYVDVPARGRLPYASGRSPVRTPPRSPGPVQTPPRNPSPKPGPDEDLLKSKRALAALDMATEMENTIDRHSRPGAMKRKKNGHSPFNIHQPLPAPPIPSRSSSRSSSPRCKRSVDGGCQDDSSPYFPDVKQSSTIHVNKFTVVNNMRMEMFGHVLFLPAHSAETLFLMVKDASSQLLVSSEPFEISRGQTSLTIPPLTALDPNQWYNLTLMTSSHKILQTVMYKPQRGTRVLGLKLFHRLDGQLKGAIQLSGNVERLVSVDLYDTTETFDLIKSVQLTGLHAKPVRLDDKFPRLSFGHSYLVAVVDYETNENIFTQTFTVHRTTNRGHSTRFAGRTLIDHLFDSLR